MTQRKKKVPKERRRKSREISGEFTQIVPFNVVSDEDGVTVWIDGDLSDEVSIKPGYAEKTCALIEEHGQDWWLHVPKDMRE